jgi:hypothetical protein
MDPMKYQCGILAVCLMGMGAGLMAQMTDKEREAAIAQGQQRVEFRRTASLDAERRAQDAVRKLTTARNRLQAAEKELAAATVGLKRAEEDLEYDRSRAAEAKKAYEDESAAFQVLRRGQ